MYSDSPLQISNLLLTAMGTRMFVYYQDRVPMGSPVLLVSNHRSFMDPLMLMAAIKRPIRFACHHYMGQVPVMRDMVNFLGAFPLEKPEHRQQTFFQQATELLQSRQVVGVFPEGTPPMVKFTKPNTMGDFQRGFAHLAMRSPVTNLAVLPVAIASQDEVNNSAIPLKVLSFFDPSEPLFNQNGWHPMVIYRRSAVLIGRPCWITPHLREQYQGKQAKKVVADLIGYCQKEIGTLLSQGCY